MKSTNHLETFYRDLYARTSGFVFNWPLGNQLKLGDFFTLRPGGIGTVGNIYESYFQLSENDRYLKDLLRFESPVLEPFLEEDHGWQTYSPEKDVWEFKNGCYTDYSSKNFVTPHKKKVENSQVNAYTTKLAEPGSYFFTARRPLYVRMPDFYAVHKEIIRRLTTEFYNFNDVYVITEVCIAERFSLGINSHFNAELVVSTEDYWSGDMVGLLSEDIDHAVERVEGMAVIKLKQPGGVIAFKAKKMGLSMKAKEILTNHIYNSSEPEIRKYAVEMINHDLFHLFPSIEINPGNANEFFSWSEMSLEDAIKLANFITF